MKILKILNLLFIIFPFILIGQSLKNDLTKLSYDELKNYYFNPKTPKKDLINYADAYLSKGKIENKGERISRGFYFKALLFYNIDNNKAIKLLDSVIKYSENGNDSFFPAAAYCEKGNLLVKMHLYKRALNNFNKGEAYSKKNNIDYYYIIRENIAITKSENLGEVDEALKIYKECYKYYKTKDIHDNKYSSDYLSIIFGIADAFKSLQNVDSCSYYNNIGYKESKTTQNKNFLSLFILNEGANQILRKNYKATIDSITISLPQIIKNNNTINIIASYYYYGKAYEGLNNKEQALTNFKKIDSIYQLNKNILTPEFIDGYKFLISYYRERNDKENELKYITKYMSIDSTLNQNYKELNKVLQNDYDIPHLMKDKQILINALENKRQYYYWAIVLLFSIILSLIFNQRRLENIYKKRFENLVLEKFSNQGKEDSKTIKNKQLKIVEDKSIGISDELIEQILEKLNEFELKKEFLNSNISIQSLSDSFKTNTKYLSKIINNYKNKTFTQYVNDLRIDYALESLHNDSRARKYTMQALSLEYGFNNPESFNTAFYKKTGIKPSYFIKELEKV